LHLSSSHWLSVEGTKLNLMVLPNPSSRVDSSGWTWVLSHAHHNQLETRGNCGRFALTRQANRPDLISAASTRLTIRCAGVFTAACTMLDAKRFRPKRPKPEAILPVRCTFRIKTGAALGSRRCVLEPRRCCRKGQGARQRI
jgi:hypothetical protein